MSWREHRLLTTRIQILRAKCSCRVRDARSREDAEDVVQEAFCRAHRKLSSFEGQASFYTWFYRIVVNLCIDETRKRKRSRLVDLGDDVQAGPLATSDALYLNLDESDPTQSVERAQLRNVLMKAVSALLRYIARSWYFERLRG